MAISTEQKSSITSSSPKRRKLSHAGDDWKDEDTQSSNSESESCLDQAYLLGKSSKVSAKRKQNVSISTAKNSSSMVTSVGIVSGSNMLQLQVDEMLVAVEPNYVNMMVLTDIALRRLKILIESIEDRAPLTIAEAEKIMYEHHNIKIPFPDIASGKDALFKLAYSRPSEVNVAGSYALKTMAKEERIPVVDMVVTMPARVFQDKDYLNFRYFYKRAYYLACLAAGLQDRSAQEFEFWFESLGGNSLQPILVAKPASDTGVLGSKFLIRILPAAPEECFNASRLLPSKNAIRPKSLPLDTRTALAPTPFYNGTVLADCNMKRYLNLLHRSSKHAKGFKDACILGRIWLRQRGFHGTISAGGFGPFEWSILTALLLQGGGPKGQNVLSSAYTNFQLFKAVLQYLSSADLIANPFLFQSADVSLNTIGYPIFYDGPRGHNFLYKMTPWSYVRLQEEAKISIEMLNNSIFDQFEATFIYRKDQPLHDYDLSFQLPNSEILDESISPDYASQGVKLCSKVYAILKEGLTDRVQSVHLKTAEPNPWPLKAPRPVITGDLFIGVVFDPANVGRSVDHGPAADDKRSAAHFRKFWGEKTELRRFRDGSIVESLVWTSSSDELTIMEIVSYLLNRHLGKELAKRIKINNQSLSQLLPGFEISTKAFRDAKAAFDTLEQDIRRMENLPLQPKILSATSPQLRLSSVTLPVFSRQQDLTEPLEVLVQFEGSGRWPDDLVAIQQTKIAFLQKIGDLLTAAVAGLTAGLVLENVDSHQSNHGCLDVIYPSGATFRLRLYIDREQFLLEKLAMEKTVDIQNREEVISAKRLITYKCIQLPLHNQSMATHCSRYPALSLTVRLVKRWFDSHMLSGLIRAELIELFALRTFLLPYPWRAPSSASTGFLRTLQFLSRWDWRATPLIVDFSGAMTSEDIATINARLQAWRKIDPGMNRMVILAATSHDMTGTAFSDGLPSKVVATRMTALAQSACLIVKQQMLELDMDTLFRSHTDDYDFVVHISPWFRASQINRRKASGREFKNLDVQTKGDPSLVGYEPISTFLEELERLYTNSILLFHDPVGGLVIGGLWNPHAQSQTLRPNLPHSSRPRIGQTQDLDVEIDKVTILSEISRLGGDMIASIELH